MVDRGCIALKCVFPSVPQCLTLLNDCYWYGPLIAIMAQLEPCVLT